MSPLIATYRLQLTADFGFADAAGIVPYLRDLGVSHVYASPILKARAGSTHGYDVVDPTRLNPELGGDQGFAELTAALRAAGLGLIVDFVPNHMGVHGADNAWWLDALEWGPASPHARAFDIDWTALPHRARPGVLIPILGSPYGEALAKGEIALRYDPREGSFSAWYFEHRLPIALASYREILRIAARHGGDPDREPARAILALARERAPLGAPTRDAAPAFKSALAAIEGGAEVIAAGLGFYRVDGPRGVRPLHRVLERQFWRLAHWRLASREINYRRFFDVSTLAGLRVEDEGVFRELHARIAALIREGALDGLRIDHIDGLTDPAGYCRRLCAMIRELQPKGRPFHVFVEKILGEDERLPGFDGVEGTTGYEWLNVISQVLADRDGLPTLDRAWQNASGGERPFAEILADAKRDVLRDLLASEREALCRALFRIAAGQFATRDFGRDRLAAAFEHFAVELPVYRTYVTPAGAGELDRAVIARAIAQARRAVPAADGPVLDFLRDALTLDLVAPGRPGYSRRRVGKFVRKAQQFTGPVMAKSLEDTAGYRFHRLLAFNEVGGDPASGGLSLDAFHHRMRERVANRDGGLTATATHDTKRGEDARARLLALTELSEEWEAAVAQWHADSAHLVRYSGKRRSPSAAHAYMLFQAMLGAWPVDGNDADLAPRLKAYARKAAREGKAETSWLDPDEDYESGLVGFIDGLLRQQPFVRDFDAFAQRVALLGALNSLTQIALKIAMPGIPDFYQGSEFWDLSLVDPDNRRPVDFAARERVLAGLSGEADLRALAPSWRDGRLKLALIRQLLAWRRSLGDVLARGDYRPLAVEGPHRDHVIAFARVHGNDAAILVAGRHFAALTDGGRRWPRPDAWQGHVELVGFSLVDRRRAGARPGALALSNLFDPVPVAACRAVSIAAPAATQTPNAAATQSAT